MKICFVSYDDKIPNETYDTLEWFGGYYKVSPEHFNREALSMADAVVIRGASERILGFLYRLRKTSEFALIPVIAVQEEEDEIVRHSVDFYALEYEFPEKKLLIKDIIESINKRNKALYPLRGEASEEILILRYLITRKTSIKPLINIRTLKGYSYPQIEPFIDEDAFIALQRMSKNKLLKGKFIDRVHLCPFCGSAHLNFKEVCPKCKSANIHIEDTIHHFRCGYVGPESDFEIPGTDELVCPKCHKKLRHIGIDYDKPSQMYLCDSCGNVFEEPVVEITCFNCKRTFDADHAAVFDVKEYSITSYGENVGKLGFIEKLKFDEVIKNYFNTVSFEFFKTMVNYSMSLEKRYGRKFVVAKIRFYGMEEFQREETYEKTFEMMKNASQILKENLRDTDIVCALNDKTILILLPETSKKTATKVLSRLIDKLSLFLPHEIAVKTEIIDNYAEVSKLFAEAPKQ